MLSKNIHDNLDYDNDEEHVMRKCGQHYNFDSHEPKHKTMGPQQVWKEENKWRRHELDNVLLYDDYFMKLVYLALMISKILIGCACLFCIVFSLQKLTSIFNFNKKYNVARTQTIMELSRLLSESHYYDVYASLCYPRKGHGKTVWNV